MAKYNGILISKQQLKGKIYVGINNEYPELEKKIITPTEEQQVIKPEKYGFSEVVIEPMDITKFSEYQESLDISNKVLNKEEI